LGVDGDGPDVVGSETAHLSCFFEGVVTVCWGKEDEFEVCVAGGFAFGVEIVSGDDDGGSVWGAAALGGDPTGVRAVESEEIGECPSGCFLDDWEGGRDLEDVELEGSTRDL